MTVFVASMLPVVLSLGAWQLDRAAEKRDYQNRYFDRVGALAVPPPADLSGAAFLRVRIDGRFESGRHYLIDNRPKSGRPGYWVVSRFLADDGRRFLVNRGWLAAPEGREALPAVPDPDGPVTLTGVVWPDTGLTPLLAEDPWPSSWPRRVQRLNVDRMAAEGTDVVPAEIRLEPDQPGVLTALPLGMDFRPERHTGYAVQWFGLAVVLVVGYLVFGFRRAEVPGERRHD
jgi:cytochrome oxidase assembly protein ShyY1